MKHLIVTFILGVISISTAFACNVCKSQQPNYLADITHGGGPDDNWDYVIVSVSVVLVIGTLVGSLYQIIRPGEKNAEHIKRSILTTNV